MAETDQLHDLRHILEHNLGLPFTEGNGIAVLPDEHEAALTPLIDAIRHAWRSVDLCTFDLPRGAGRTELAAALAERAQAGVKVRVVLDAVGARDAGKDFVRGCRSAGIRMSWFRPRALPASGRVSYRCQRRILVVDNLVGFTGGAGIASSPGHDVQLRVQGPAVRGLAGAFGQIWAEAGNGPPEVYLDPHEQPAAGNAICQVIRGSSGMGWDDLATAAHALLSAATKRVRIIAPYLLDEPAWIGDVALAVRDGVGVDIIVPGRVPPRRFGPATPDAVIGQLTAAQAMVWAFEPGLVHGALMIIDDAVALVGSVGVGRRGTDRDEELAVCVIDETVVTQLARKFNEALWSSRRL
ncbi:MAG: phosphatidylserine/phosphatidylglycerophosphate/cardiolipin synthase family protein [Sporichthyaceae bacterium]|nr:phosphatidylserine/phosphatidylglycerophosphate/cardiolipin synthase family protein [Sporichthyaceae bacterium]